MSDSPSLIIRISGAPKRKPHPDLLAMRELFGPFVPIPPNSPFQRIVHGHARKLAKEMRLNYPPYERGMRGHQFIIVSEDGRAIGSLHVVYAEWVNAPPAWLWAWVYIIPSERGQGWTGRIWSWLRSLIPTIEPDPPFSAPVARFFVERDDVSERVRSWARFALGGTDDE